MANLTYFETLEAYNSYVASEDFVTPNISYCEENGSTFYHDSERIPVKAVYETAEDDSEVLLFYNTNAVKFIIVDDEKIDVEPGEPYEYTFETAGEHTVHIALKDDSRKLPSRLFMNCTALKKLQLADYISVIEEYSINYCTALIEMNIPQSLKYVKNGNFNICPYLELSISTLNFSIGDNCFSTFKGFSGPITINGSVGNASFNNVPELTSVTINGSVGNAPFVSCYALKEFTINGNLNGSSVGGNCPVIEKITINGNVNNSYNFSNSYSNLKEVFVGGNIVDYGIQYLSSPTVSAITVTGNIGNNCFTSNLNSLSKLSIGGNIGDNNFTSMNSSALTEFNVGGTIGYYNFRYFSGLTSIVITHSVGNSCFYQCGGLENITFSGNSIGSIGYSVFEYCNSVTSVTVDSNCQFMNVGGRPILYGNGSLKEITFTDKVRTIYDYFAYSFGSLTSVTISEGVTQINPSAFEYCTGLTSVTIPSTVTNIDNLAFYANTTGTRTITFATTNSSPDIGNSAFGTGSNAFLIHCGAKIPFDQNPTWDNYRSSISVIESGCEELERWIKVDAVCDNGSKKDVERKEISTDNEIWYETDVYRTGSTSLGSCVWADVYLNNQWSASTKPGPTTAYTVYESFSNYHVDNGVAEMQIKINGKSSFAFKVRNYSDSYNDFVVVLNLDDTTTRSAWTTSYTTASTGTYADGYVKFQNRGKSSETNWYDVSFTNIGSGEHTIRIIYGKNGYSSSYDDKGYVAIPN